MNRNPTRLIVHLMLVILTGLLLTCGIGACDLDGVMATATRPTVAEAAATMPLPLNMSRGVDKWALWTEGTHLRGANIYQRRVYPELDGPYFMGPGPVGPPYTQGDFDRLAALGANYVNISHPGLFTETPPYTLDQEIQDNLDNLLTMIAQADMFAVISFRTGPGRSEFWAFWGEDTVSDPENGWFDPGYYNNRIWGKQAAQDAWVAMWRYTAERYRDNPIVVGYDLMCEPNSNEVGSYPLGDPLDIWDPEEFYTQYGGTLYDWNQLYPRISAAIRQVDPDTPILIGGMSYSAIEWLPYLEPTGDLHTVYTVHQYAPHTYTHQPPDSLVCTYPGWCDLDWDGYNDDWLDWAWLEGLLATVDDFAATHGVPMAVNEFGVMRWEPGAADFMDDQMDFFEQRGMNYALWVWEPSWEPWAEKVDAFNFRHGPDPNNHTDVESSDLMDVIVEHWGGNTIRPSSTSLLSNGSFEGGGRIPAPWKGKNLTLEDKRVCNTARYGSCSFLMVGTKANKSLKQVVNISGNAGDSFTLSGWSKARNPLPEGGSYCLQARVFHTDGTKKSYRTCFTKTTHGWQYRKRTFTVAKDYNKIVVFLRYAKQGGKAWFDDVRLVAQ